MALVFYTVGGGPGCNVNNSTCIHVYSYREREREKERKRESIQCALFQKSFYLEAIKKYWKYKLQHWRRQAYQKRDSWHTLPNRYANRCAAPIALAVNLQQYDDGDAACACMCVCACMYVSMWLWVCVHECVCVPGVWHVCVCVCVCDGWLCVCEIIGMLALHTQALRCVGMHCVCSYCPMHQQLS